MLLDQTFENMPFSSTRKNTTLGDTDFKGKSTDASASGDAEEPLVDSTVECRQGDNRSDQGSPVSVGDAPDDSPPFNGLARSLEQQKGGNFRYSTSASSG
jgi:hypothetical protein